MKSDLELELDVCGDNPTLVLVRKQTGHRQAAIELTPERTDRLRTLLDLAKTWQSRDGEAK